MSYPTAPTPRTTTTNSAKADNDEHTANDDQGDAVRHVRRSRSVVVNRRQVREEERSEQYGSEPDEKDETRDESLGHKPSLGGLTA